MAYLSAIYDKINKYCRQNGLLESGKKVLVAVSGGADSVFLLRYLMAEDYEVEVAHCNFHLRGEESNRDEQFVRELCETHHITLHVKDFNTPDYAQTNGVSIEMAARTLRYEWFEQVMHEIGSDTLAVAHHRDDNIESMLLNLVRGTGIKGLRGMQPRNGHIVRPLLCISRSDIITGLNEMQQSYVDDSTNFEDQFSRNKIRLDVMPLLRSINAGADNNIATAIENINETFKVYDESIRHSILQCSEQHNDSLYINKERLQACASPLSVLHEILAPCGFNRSQILLISQCESSGKEFCSPTHRLIIDRNQFIISPITEDADIEDIPLEAYPDIEVSIVEADSCTIQRQNNYAYFDADKVKGKLVVRLTKTGDKFRPFGMKGCKLVSDLMTDMKVNLLEKRQQLVVCDDERILWVVGRRASDECKVTSSTKRIIWLKRAKG